MVFGRPRPEGRRPRHPAPARCVGLLGDNGAGKSTLIKILSGVVAPDRGEIRIDGRPTRLRSPKAAMRLGIETVYQYNSMVPTMTVARNLFIGREPLRFSILGLGVMDLPKMRREVGPGHRRRRPSPALARRAGRRVVGRPAPGRGHRPRHAFPVAGADPRRADQPPVGQGDRQGARLRPAARARRASPASSSATTCTTCSPAATAWWRWRGAKIVLDKPKDLTSIEEFRTCI